MHIKSTRFFSILTLIVGSVFVLSLVPLWASAQNVHTDSDKPITGTALTRASDAALEYIGEGRVTETEAADEQGIYEVEITRDDGTQVDVHLDSDFTVLNSDEESDTNENESEDNLNDSGEATDDEDDSVYTGGIGSASVFDGNGTTSNILQHSVRSGVAEGQQSWETTRIQLIQLLQQLIVLLQG